MPNKSDISNRNMATDPMGSGRDASGLRSGWLLVFTGLVLAALLAWQTGQYAQRSWESPQRWNVVLNDQQYQLDAAQLQHLEDFSTAHFSADGDQTRALLRAGVNAQLDVAFAQVSARLPEFADWYYSLGGEYSRLSMAVLGHLNVVDDGYVARRAASILFPEPAWANALARLDSAASQMLVSRQADSQVAWLEELQQRLSSSRVPAPVTSMSGAAFPLELDDLVGQLQGLQQTVMMESRLALSTVGAAGVAGSALWRAVSTQAALKTAGVASSRGMAKGAGRIAARGASGAAAGTVACLPGGPVALACAAVAAAGTWVATDWLLLQVDEALNRDEMLAELEQGLAGLRLSLEAELLQAYDERIAAWNEAANVQIEKTFSPYRTR